MGAVDGWDDEKPEPGTEPDPDPEPEPEPEPEAVADTVAWCGMVGGTEGCDIMGVGRAQTSRYVTEERVVEWAGGPWMQVVSRYAVSLCDG